MLEPDPTNMLSFAAPEDLGLWLAANHATASQLWVQVFKKGAGLPSVTWDEIVQETLCWGWIDGIKKSWDEQSYIQRLSPRRARSVWSKRNREHVERLTQQGRMKEAGLVHVRAAQADGRWASAYAVSEAQVPADFLAALECQPQAQAFFQTLNKSSTYVIAAGLASAKKPETRMRRFTQFMEMLARQEKPGAG